MTSDDIEPSEVEADAVPKEASFNVENHGEARDDDDSTDATSHEHTQKDEEQTMTTIDDAPKRIGIIKVGVFTAIRPIRTHKKMAEAPNAARIGWIYTIGFSSLYALVSLILGIRGFVPYSDPVLPIDPANYYYVQAIFNIPVSTVIMGIGFGILYGLCRLFKSSARPSALWGTFVSTLVVPFFIFMWIPEFFHSILAEPPDGHLYPLTSESGDFWRLAVVAPIFLALYSCLGVYGCSGLNWWQTPIATLPAGGAVGVLNMIVKR